MDAFRLLTRSTNLKPGSSRHGSTQSHHVPSDGRPMNPQLFPELETSTNLSKKRKRGLESDTVPQGLSFFGETQETNNHAAQRIQDDSKVDASASISTRKIAGSWSLEDRKRVLKSHKVKVTDLQLLASSSAQPSVEKFKKGKSEAKPNHKKLKEAARLYPQPLTTFEDLNSGYGISLALAQNIREEGYYVPTEVQIAALPLLLGGIEGKPIRHTGEQSQIDLLTIAPTGSGKTLAFLIPLINSIISARKRERHVSALILVPTKELVTQIVLEGRKLCAKTGVHITAMRKGMELNSESLDPGVDDDDEPAESEIDESEDKPNKKFIVKSDIIVSTPLSLSHAVADSPLPNIKSLILDEADVLLDPLFRDQTMSVWNACNNPSLRTSFWSATIGSSIEDLVKSTLSSRQGQLGVTSSPPLIRLVIGLKDTSLPNIDHKLIYAATEPGKLLGLRQLLHPPSSISVSSKRLSTSNTPILRPPFLVFTQTIPRAIALHSELRYDIPLPAGGSSRIAVLHSDLSDTARADIMTRFRKAQIWVLITTDLLSRGIDFRGVNGVVNYDIPTSSAGYVHRAGRTGRAGREGGVVVTFYTKEDIPYVKNVANVIASSEKLRNKADGQNANPETQGIQKWLLDALPDVSKADRKRLKKRGVEARRPMSSTTTSKTQQKPEDGKRIDDEAMKRERRKARISTKPGYERRKQRNRKDAVMGSRVRKDGGKMDEDAGDGWEGFED